MPKSVSIYQRDGIVYVLASHQTKAGFWVDDSNVVRLSVPVPMDMGRAVYTALAQSREGVPTPPPSAKLTGALLAAANISSWKTFAKSAKSVGIRQNDDTIKITPYKNLGGKEGFVPMPDKVILMSSSDESLGEAVIRAIEIAE
jgi:hypothetical protein